MRDYLGYLDMEALKEKYSERIINKSIDLLLTIGFQSLPAYLNTDFIKESMDSVAKKEIDYQSLYPSDYDFFGAMNLFLQDIYNTISNRVEGDYSSCASCVIEDDILPYIRKTQKIDLAPVTSLYIQQSDVSDNVWSKICDELELEPDEINHIGIFKY